MTTVYDTFAGFGAAFMGAAGGETVVITPKGGAPVPVAGVIVLRDPLQFLGTRQGAGDGGEYTLEIHVPKDLYPGRVTIKGDTVELLARVGDTIRTRKTVTRWLGQRGGFFYLGLD